MAQRGRPKKNISEIKELISNIKPAISASECAGKETTTVTYETPPYTFGYAYSENGKIRPAAMKEIENVFDYCSLEAITPLELIEQHKSFKKLLNSPKQAKNEVTEGKIKPAFGGNYFSDYAKRKSQGKKD